MSTSTRIKNELAQTASTNVQDDMVRLQDPRSWTRMQKFKDGEGVTIRDYLAAGTDVTARVRERDGKIIEVSLMTMASLDRLHHKETYVKGRLWDEGQTTDTSRATIRGREFCFGMAKTQETGLPRLLISPSAYFKRTGEAWVQDMPIDTLLPSWLKKKAPGVYQTDGREYESVAEALIECGFTELDALAVYHEEQILLSISAAAAQNAL